MTLIEKARELRKILEKAMTATQSLTEAEAITATCLHPKWSGNSVQYTAGQRVQDDGTLYTVLQTHTSQPDSTNPYAKGDKVAHNGKTWVSDIDGNVWEPGVYGWTEVAE